MNFMWPLLIVVDLTLAMTAEDDNANFNSDNKVSYITLLQVSFIWRPSVIDLIKYVVDQVRCRVLSDDDDHDDDDDDDEITLDEECVDNDADDQDDFQQAQYDDSR